MSWDWYQIKEVVKVMEKDTPDETLTVDIGDGDETIRFIKGDSIGIIFRDYLLFPNMNDRNPFTAKDSVGATIYQGFYWVGINRGES